MKNINNAFSNCEEVISSLYEESLIDFDIKGKDDLMKNTRITLLGVEVRLKNKNNQKFNMIVMPDYLSDRDELRKLILTMSDAIRQNFPELSESA